MIESMTIASTATFGPVPEVLNGLSRFNFLFGSNGTGKTTVSRVIADENGFPTCKVTWKAGTKLQAMVYNHDFVERNFTQSMDLKGAFTLGEKQVDTLTKLAAAKVGLDKLTTKIESLNETLRIPAKSVSDSAACRYTITIHVGRLNGRVVLWIAGVRSSSVG